ncbi:hypothetical protein c7_R1082 [Megavirus courdo7]|uniref:Uncharacterized protein n=1 Tax=Megavirus courdo7 TaxID=1128135 RepID=H2EC06_9VIRU|nr:hypothetical protein c7_R1082 [Megavirus courdo7]
MILLNKKIENLKLL